MQWFAGKTCLAYDQAMLGVQKQKAEKADNVVILLVNEASANYAKIFSIRLRWKYS